MDQIRKVLKRPLREMLECFHQGLSSELEQLLLLFKPHWYQWKRLSLTSEDFALDMWVKILVPLKLGVKLQLTRAWDFIYFAKGMFLA